MTETVRTTIAPSPTDVLAAGAGTVRKCCGLLHPMLDIVVTTAEITNLRRNPSVREGEQATRGMAEAGIGCIAEGVLWTHLKNRKKHQLRKKKSRIQKEMDKETTI